MEKGVILLLITPSLKPQIMRRTATVVIVIIACLTACFGQVSDSKTARVSAVTETSSIPTDSTTYYFPIKSFNGSPTKARLDTFIGTWFSTQLFALREPVLYIDSSQQEVYRFAWLRTFHHPIAIRIQQQAGKVVLFWKLCDGAGGYAPGKLTIDRQRTLDKKNWDEFIRRLEAIDFWHLTAKGDAAGFDGSEWILEGKSGGKYHVTERWMPGEKGGYYQCCDYLLSLTDLKIDGREKY